MKQDREGEKGKKGEQKESRLDREVQQETTGQPAGQRNRDREPAREILKGEKEGEGAEHTHRQKTGGTGKGKQKEKEKKKKITAAWEREGSRGQLGTQKRGDRAPRARHSPQLSLSALPGDSAASDASLSCSPPFLFRNSGRLAVLYLRENTHVSQL